MKVQITALFASDRQHLGKSFTKVEGELKVSSYPHVLNFQSAESTIRTVQELGAWAQAVADKGGCLLKGINHRPLSGEPRAGSTDPNDETEWVCLDLDGIAGMDTVEDFLAVMPSAFRSTSHVVQYSSSMGIVDKGLSAHIFFLIKSTKAAVLKRWLQRINFETPVLLDNLKLARTGAALKYSLDITTCQNDKLIYVAPAQLGKGVKDTFEGERIQFVKRRYAVLNYDFATEIDTREIQRMSLKQLNVLRKSEGLSPRRSDATKVIEDVEVLKNVKDTIEITGERRTAHFTYLNLNGGDSWGYYYSNRNPRVLRNFKSEPGLLLAEVFPEYYAAAVRAADEHGEHAGSSGDSDVAVTPAPDQDVVGAGDVGEETEGTDDKASAEGWYTEVGINAKTGNYFGLRYSPSTREFDFADIGSRIQVKDYCKSYAVPVPEFLDRWQVGYDFVDPTYKLDLENKAINLYQPPPMMFTKKNTTMPKTIERVIKHVTGDDDEAYERFLNWNACIVQHRRVIGTAWLLSGTQGTGKGVYFNEIMAKVLGLDYVARATLPTFEKEFNGFMERALLVFVDEIRITELTKASTALSNLKQLITDSQIALRKMHTNAYLVENHANFVFASNHHDSMEVDPSDRRFLICPRQEAPLGDAIRISDVEDKIPGELERFAGYLLGREANLLYAREMYHSAERLRLQHLSRDSSDEVVDALRRGNAKFFVDNAPDRESTGEVALNLKLDSPPTYEEILQHLMSSLGNQTNLSRDMLSVLFYYICGVTFKTPHKFTKFLGKRGVDMTTIRIGDDVMRGVKGLTFHAENTTVREWKQWLQKRKAHIKSVPSTGSKQRTS